MVDENGNTEEAVAELNPEAGGLEVFAALMDAMAPEEPGTEAGPNGEAAEPAPAGAGLDAAAGEGAGAAGAPAEPPIAGAGGEPPVPGADDSLVDAQVYDANWGTVLNGMEQAQQKVYEGTALSEVKTEFSNYFDALNSTPRALVGTEVPSLRGDGAMETLRDSADAKDWQESVKQILFEEVKSRAKLKADEARPMAETLTASINLFQNNPDLIPNTRQFDRELVDRVFRMARPYELRVDGKLHGYTIPIQPLVDQIREQLVESRAAVPPQPSPAQQRAAEQTRTPAGQFAGSAPQAGIPSRSASSGTESEDFSALFGTLGLPTLRI